MKKVLLIFFSLAMVLFGSVAQVVVTGQVVTYASQQSKDRELNYCLGISEEYQTAINNGCFSIAISDSKLPTTLEITGFGDRRIIEGGTLILNEESPKKINLGEIYAFENIYLEKIKIDTDLSDIRIRWITNVDICQEMWVEISIPKTTFGQWETLVQSKIGKGLQGEISLNTIEGAIARIKQANVPRIYISVVGYLNKEGKMVRVASSDSWQVDLQLGRQ